MERELRATLPKGRFVNVPPDRARTMAAIRSRGNKTTELLVRMMLVRAGVVGWRMHDDRRPGRPDFSFSQLRAAIFVHGCFWHSHSACRHGHTPRSRTEYWILKLRKNVS